jgi:CDP-glycerol glycerophosphotransferase (TagB/SpsB family)
MVPNVHLLVRPHPSDDSVAIREIVRAFPAERCEVWGSDPVEDLLLGSDVLVTQSSTVGVEAALLGVPVMTVHFSGGESIVPYARLGISLEARSAEEIAEILKRLLDGPSRRAYAERSHAALEYLMGPLDGKASRRVAQLIARMMSASSSVPT